jgi:uncharacterized protein YkwD
MRRRWGLLAVFVAVAGLLVLSAALFLVSMFTPVTHTDSVNAQGAVPSASVSLPTGTSSGSGALGVASPAAASPSAAAPRTSRPAAKTSPSPAGTGVTAYEAQVLTLVNQERAKAGCAALTRDSKLASAARAHSADMAAKGYFDHTTPSGVTAAQRITNAGYRWSSMGENIAEGQRTPAEVMQAWMNSSGHRANILNCGFRNIGVGLAYNSSHTPFWTQDFATPA